MSGSSMSRLCFRLTKTCVALAVVAGSACSSHADSALGWAGGFVPPGLTDIIDSTATVYALATYAGPTGDPLLFVGGEFRIAGDLDAQNLVGWNGRSWVAIGNLPGDVHAMAAGTVGGVSRLYIGMDDYPIYTWDGTTLAPFAGINQVRALAFYDDGGGMALYVGGTVAGCLLK